MRMLAISWGISDRRGGGEPIGSYELIRHLALAGASIDVVTPWLDVERPLPDGVRVHAVTGGARRGNSGANKWAMLREARRRHRAERFDATHVVSQFTAFPIDNRPFVMSGCWLLPAARPPRRAWKPPASAAAATDLGCDVAFALLEERLRGWRLERTLREADLVIVRQRLGVSPLARKSRRVEYVPLGIDLDAFTVTPGVREPVVLYAGNLEPYKNVDGLIRAFASIARRAPRARLRLAGDGRERVRLAALARRLGVAGAVEFLGHLPRRELLAELGRTRVFCLASWCESFGLVSIEAMACGTPVVVSDRISGSFDYLDEGVNGFHAPPDRPEVLAERLGRLLLDPERARAMGEAARATVEERFGWRAIARRHLELYGSLAP